MNDRLTGQFGPSIFGISTNGDVETAEVTSNWATKGVVDLRDGGAPNGGVGRGTIALLREPAPGDVLEIIARRYPPDPLSYRVTKRAIDVVVSLAALVLALPILILLAVLIRLDSRGPALFHQERVGAGGRTFRFYKFRTMYVDARDRFPELYAHHDGTDDLEELRFKYHQRHQEPLPHDRIEFVADRPGHDRRYAIDATRIGDELGWEPSVSFEEGIAATIRWYRENEAWWRPIKERTSIITWDEK